jgi:hypothetical protein
MSDVLKAVNLFFKSRKTAESKIEFLYVEFLKYSKMKIDQPEFERTLLKLRKGVITGLKSKCLEYKNKSYGYEKFVREQENITKELWYALTGLSPEPLIKPETIVTPPINTESLENLIPPSHISKIVTKCQEKIVIKKETLNKLPSDWGVMHWASKEKFVNSCDDTDLLHTIISMETTWAVKNACQIRLKSLGIEIEKIQKSAEHSKILCPENYPKFMPLDWDKMDFSQRLDFAKEVQDPDFKKYVLGQDARLTDYFEKMDTPQNKVKMCRTIFAAPISLYTPKARELASTIIDHLNRIAGAGLEYMECQNSKMIEIRQVLR